MTGCIQLGHCKDVSQGVVISINIKGQPVQIFVEFLNYYPLEGKKFQLVCRVLGYSLGQAPTSIGYFHVCAILADLVEGSSQARPTGISVELERLCEVCIGKNRCSGTQSLQVIKGPLAPVVPLNGSLLASIFTQSQLMQGLGYLCEFWDKLPEISHESQETSGLCDVFLGLATS